MRRLLPACLPAILVACGSNAEGHEAPKLPPLSLAPKLPLFRQLAARVSAPENKRMAQLEDLMATAFAAGGVRDRVQAMAKRNLLEAEDAFWILERSLAHDDVNMRGMAARELGSHGTQASILPLLKRLKYEQDPGVLVSVVDSLVKLGNHAGLPKLVALMERADSAQRAGMQTIEILKGLGIETGERPTYGQLKGWLRDLHRRWRQTGVVEKAGGDKGPREPDELTTTRVARHLAQLEGFQLRPVDDSRFVLGRAGVLSLGLLGEAVQAKEPYLRNHALEIVGGLGRPARSLGDKILPLLADPLSRVYAAQALGNIGATQALPHLLAMLESPEPEARAAAAEALGPLGCREAVAPLTAVLQDEKETMDVRVRAAFSLAIFELRRPAFDFLKERKAQGDYHEPTVDELMSRVEQLRQDRR